MMTGWIDVSVNLKNGMARWPDDLEVRIEKKLDIDRGDICNVSVLSMGSHTGTHMDAPCHFVKNGKSIDEMPFEAAIGRARVIAIRDPESIKPKELERYGIRAGERLLEMGQEDLGQTMLVEADLLEKEGQMSTEGTKKLRYGTRKLR